MLLITKSVAVLFLNCKLLVVQSQVNRIFRQESLYAADELSLLLISRKHVKIMTGAESFRHINVASCINGRKVLNSNL